MVHDLFTPLTSRRYAALHPLLAEVFEAMALHADRWLAEEGRYDLRGEELFALVGEHPLKPAEAARLEVHDRYIDLQWVLRGEERYGWASRTACRAPQGAFDTERDILFFSDRPESVVTARAGEFLIFFPEDAHAPLINPAPGEEASVRKVIFKIKA